MATSKLTKEEQFLAAWEKYQPFGPDAMPQGQFEFTEEGDERYVFDWAWPNVNVAVEIQGLGYGHQRIAGLKRDCHKARLAIEYGWTLIPVSTACMGSEADREVIIWQVADAIYRKANNYETIHSQTSGSTEEGECTCGTDEDGGTGSGAAGPGSAVEAAGSDG